MPREFSAHFPEHEKYFFLIFRDGPDEQTLLRLKKNLEIALQFCDVSFAELPSFGFDLLVYSFYRDDELGAWVLRISPGLADKISEKVMRAIELFLTMPTKGKS
jgi:hypothetical protein